VVLTKRGAFKLPFFFIVAGLPESLKLVLFRLKTSEKLLTNSSIEMRSGRQEGTVVVRSEPQSCGYFSESASFLALLGMTSVALR
jgi:hypothetical protein